MPRAGVALVNGLQRALHMLRSAIAELSAERPDRDGPSRTRLSKAIEDAKRSAAMVNVELNVRGE